MLCAVDSRSNDFNFAVGLYGFAESSDEFGVLSAPLGRLVHRQKFTVQFVPLHVEVLLYFVPPLRFLATEPLPKTAFRWCAAFLPTPRGKLWPLHMVLNGLILILMTLKKEGTDFGLSFARARGVELPTALLAS